MTEEEIVTTIAGWAEADAEVAPASDAELVSAERRLDAPLPALLRRLYREVGNGGFGPGYGMLGLLSGHTDERLRAIGLWEQWTGEPPAGFEAWAWPRTMLPVAHWGNAVYSCLDLAHDGAPVVRFDSAGFVPRLAAAEADVDPAAERDADGIPDAEPTTPDSFAALFHPEAPSLADWLASWIDVERAG